MFLSYLKQHRLSQMNGEGFIFLIFLIVNDLHLQNLPVVGKESETMVKLTTFYIEVWDRRDGQKKTDLRSTSTIIHKTTQYNSLCKLEFMNDLHRKKYLISQYTRNLYCITLVLKHTWKIVYSHTFHIKHKRKYIKECWELNNSGTHWLAFGFCPYSRNEWVPHNRKSYMFKMTSGCVNEDEIFFSPYISVWNPLLDKKKHAEGILCSPLSWVLYCSKSTEREELPSWERHKHISPEFQYSIAVVCQGSRWLAIANQHLSLLAHRTLVVMVDKHWLQKLVQ